MIRQQTREKGFSRQLGPPLLLPTAERWPKAGPEQPSINAGNLHMSYYFIVQLSPSAIKRSFLIDWLTCKTVQNVRVSSVVSVSLWWFSMVGACMPSAVRTNMAVTRHGGIPGLTRDPVGKIKLRISVATATALLRCHQRDSSCIIEYTAIELIIFDIILLIRSNLSEKKGRIILHRVQRLVSLCKMDRSS